jgi:uncharacterized protein with NRDE domain
MCSLVMLRRPGTAWPLLIGANRDELEGRPWRPPGRHWPDRPDVVAGLDLEAGGSWFGLNDDGLVAAVLNRPGSLGPAAGKRSRGELVLEALDHAEARLAAAALADLDPAAYRPFNLVVADRYDAFWLRHAGHETRFGYRDRSGRWREVLPVHAPHLQDEPGRQRPTIDCQPIPPGLSMITAHDMDDQGSARIRHYRPRFAAAAPPDPGAEDWQSWIALLADRASPDGDPRHGMTIVTDGPFGTVCSHLLALPATGLPRLLFAPGRPDQTAFLPVPV